MVAIRRYAETETDFAQRSGDSAKRTAGSQQLTAGVALQFADDGMFRICFPPRYQNDLRKLLPLVDNESHQIIEQGFVDIDVRHFAKLEPATPVRVDLEILFSEQEAALLDD